MNANTLSLKAKNFWDKYSKKELAQSSLMNLEPNPEESKEKFELEKEHILQAVRFLESDVILDLGAGVGMWSLFFAPLVKKVTAVEYQQQFVDQFKLNISKLDENNIEIIQEDVVSFEPSETYSKGFLSGITIYLDDEELKKILTRIYNNSDQKCLLIHRDAFAVQEPFEIDNKYSEKLELNYNATYRTMLQYEQIFRESGFVLDYHQPMYQNNSKYNRWSETRLGLSVFRKSI